MRRLKINHCQPAPHPNTSFPPDTCFRCWSHGRRVLFNFHHRRQCIFRSCQCLRCKWSLRDFQQSRLSVCNGCQKLVNKCACWAPILSGGNTPARTKNVIITYHYCPSCGKKVEQCECHLSKENSSRHGVTVAAQTLAKPTPSSNSSIPSNATNLASSSSVDTNVSSTPATDAPQDASNPAPCGDADDKHPQTPIAESSSSASHGGEDPVGGPPQCLRSPCDNTPVIAAEEPGQRASSEPNNPLLSPCGEEGQRVSSPKLAVENMGVDDDKCAKATTISQSSLESDSAGFKEGLRAQSTSPPETLTSENIDFSKPIPSYSQNSQEVTLVLQTILKSVEVELLKTATNANVKFDEELEKSLLGSSEKDTSTFRRPSPKIPKLEILKTKTATVENPVGSVLSKDYEIISQMGLLPLERVVDLFKIMHEVLYLPCV